MYLILRRTMRTLDDNILSLSLSPLFLGRTTDAYHTFLFLSFKYQFIASRPDLTTINDILSFAKVVTAKLDSAPSESEPKTVLLPNDDGFGSLEY